MEQTVFITGATSGIGKASAKIFAKNGFKVVICGRRTGRLKQLKEKLDTGSNIELLEFDVRNKEEVFAKIDSLPTAFKNIDILINNAGNAHGLDTIDEGSTEDWDAMIDINVKGLLYVSKAIIPGMTERKKGHIINIGSVAGKEVYPKGNVYCASKFAVDAISKSMRLDLNKFGIKVSEINPGAVNTEFSTVRFKGDEEKADQVYRGFKPLSAKDIAEVIYFIATRPAHVNIAETLVFPTAQASASMINRIGD
ncbi:MAG: SDR family NAD(P)-dependent oxidoreductase [Cyclobacteriaceae bacterium]|nr:SDR family NAD(P)-dependent oxidoreductase [Cyclobacteriaceae bacterium]